MRPRSFKGRHLLGGDWVGSRDRWTPLRAVLAVCFLLALVLGSLGAVLAQTQDREVVVAEMDGAINPVSRRFIERAIDSGVESGAELVVIQLDTPGGLLSSTEKIVEALLADRVATAVFVSPKGAFAASAGTFITTAAHFAAMAPGTTIGAASPVAGGGEDLPDTLSEKVTNAVDAMGRSIAQQRGRNEEAISATVREALAYSAIEAKEMKEGNVDVSNVMDTVHSLCADLICGAHSVTRLRSAAGKPHSHRFGVMIAAIRLASTAQTVVGSPSEFSTEKHERILQHTEFLEIF